MTVRIITGDVRDKIKGLASESVHCIVTSPPFYGLRDYGTGQWEGGDPCCDHLESSVSRTAASTASSSLGGGKGNTHRSHSFGDVCGKCGAHRIDSQIGLEATPDEYVAELVAVFREVRRVLRSDGVAFINLGDSYAGGGRGGGAPDSKQQTNVGSLLPPKKPPAGLKTKDLIGIPWMVAFALRADGWWLRSANTWCKGNAMPESVTDRPTSATEMVFQLTKSERYFYDNIAVAERSVSDHPSGNGFKRGARLTYADSDGARGNEQQWDDVGGTRNLRNWWPINSKPFSGSHFATMPPDLVEICIKAGTSEKGCCAKCGAPWKRETSRGVDARQVDGSDLDRYGDGSTGVHRKVGGEYQKWMDENPKRTIGWSPSCSCCCYCDEPRLSSADATQRPGTGAPLAPGPGTKRDEQPTRQNSHYQATGHEVVPYPVVPATVLDPFFGAGTTGLVSDRLGRDCIGIELSPEYAEMARLRISGDSPLFSEVSNA